MTHNDIPPNKEGSSAIAQLSLGLRILVLATFLFMGLKIIRYGYLPAGDIRRHAAQAISGVEYTNVVVLYPGYKMNHSAGWDWLMRQLHARFGMTEDGLVAFSIVALLWLLLAAAVPWMRAPEAWLAAVLAMMLAAPALMTRWTQGRPFLLTEAILIALLLAWREQEQPSWPKIILTFAGFALSVWMHGAWYLWVLVPPAFFLAGRWRAGVALTLCWLAGSLAGALLTGHPVQYLYQAVDIAVTVLRQPAPPELLVGELRPNSGVMGVLVVLAITFLWRRGSIAQLFRSPLFWLMAICWMLGLRSSRFWDDWGMAAALVWLALQFEEILLTAWPSFPGRRLATSVLLALALFQLGTSDLDGRYTASLRDSFIDGSDPRLKGWMPEKGGIFYGADMDFFYNTFYKNPFGDWRYIVGFEPALMPPDDLKIFRNIQWNHFAWDAYQPWIEKMRPQDRLELSSGSQPILPPLEWNYAGGGIWIGRLPEGRAARR